jgi:hypothetical protein
MNNDGSTIQELSIYGGRTGVYRSFDGVNGGTIETLRSGQRGICAHTQFLMPSCGLRGLVRIST